LRALQVLRDVRLIAAEDTRHTRRLLTRYEIATPTVSYHEHNKLTRQNAILQALAEGDVALVSDAGTPAINDPGYELVVAAIAAGYAVSPVPGAAAPIAALIASGLPTAQWTYLGFLPARKSDRIRFLEQCAALPSTLLCFETPHRLKAALADVQAVFGDREMCAAREITKLHEEFVRGKVSEVQEHFAAQPPRGEFVLVIAGADRVLSAAEPAADWQDVAHDRMEQLHNAGMSASAAAKQVAQELGVNRKQVYALWLAANDS
jgi:16S rRNA (cytidine1402-2'-O)-methyltransferase